MLPDLSPAGLTHHPRLSARDHDEPDLFQRGRSDQRPSAADHVLVEGVRLLHHLRQSRDAIPASRRLGHGVGLQGRRSHRGRMDRRRRHRGRRLPQCADVRGGLSRAGDPEHRQQSVGHFEFCRHRRRRPDHLCLQGHRLRPADATRGRQRFPGGACCDAMGGGSRALEPRRDGDRALHLSRSPALDLRRSQPLSPRRRERSLAVGRSDQASRAAPDRARPLVRRRSGGGGKRGGGKGARRGQGVRGDRHARPIAAVDRAEMFIDVFKEPDWRIRRQRQEVGV